MMDGKESKGTPLRDTIHYVVSSPEPVFRLGTLLLKRWPGLQDPEKPLQVSMLMITCQQAFLAIYAQAN